MKCHGVIAAPATILTDSSPHNERILPYLNHPEAAEKISFYFPQLRLEDSHETAPLGQTDKFHCTEPGGVCG
jgi:hypothetical protein